MTEEEAIRIVDRAKRVLDEFFNATQIHVSWLNPDGRTSILHRGAGNYYARLGMAEDFCNKERAEVLADEIERNKEA